MASPRTHPHSESARAWQWLMNGWHALRDKAVSALTYFSPHNETDSADGQRWGVLATDISDHKDTVTVELELPGMKKADLDVQVYEDSLIIKGEKRYSTTRNEGALVVTERAFGRFQRVIPLPCKVTREGTRAEYKKGVLSVTLPKDRARLPHSVEVRGD
ncbi:MAG: Hsp20/alpha crystallin family protein [bacterium]